MFGLASGLTSRIEFDSPSEYFTNGDIIIGKLIIESAKAFAAKSIQLELRCEGDACVPISNEETTPHEYESVVYYNESQILFSDSSVRDSDSEEAKADYPFQTGAHEFPFKFQVPLSSQYPETVEVEDGNGSGIKWLVKAVIHWSHTLSHTSRDQRYFEMRRTETFKYNKYEEDVESAEDEVLVYLPGYAASTKTLTGKLKHVLPGKSFKKKVPLKLSLVLPKDGILQAPNLLNLSFILECSESHLLSIKQVSIQLEQEIIVNVRNYWGSAQHRKIIKVWGAKNLNMSIMPGIEYISKELCEMSLAHRLPASMKNDHFDVKYKLVCEITLGCGEKPLYSHTIRFSAPVAVRSFKNSVIQASMDPVKATQ